MYDLPVPIVMKSGSLNCLEPLRSLLTRTTVALPLRFTDVGCSYRSRLKRISSGHAVAITAIAPSMDTKSAQKMLTRLVDYST